VNDKTNRCVVCDTEKSAKMFRCREIRGTFCVDNICYSCRGARERAKLRLELLEVFGGKCMCCGESHPYFLTLEHIKGVGHKKNKMPPVHVLLREAKKDGWDRTKYELLCISCNFAKGHYGQCPHRTGITIEQVMEDLRKKANAKIGYSHRKYGVKGWFKTGYDKRRPLQQPPEAVN
jgi:hypothetical protein